MYAKYQEAVDALRHEQLGRKQTQAILERVLYEIEEKAAVILDERAEHEKLVEAYSLVDQKLQHSLVEQTNLEKTIQELRAVLRQRERDYTTAQKENLDLQKQVAVLLKECKDVQLRCGASERGYVVNDTSVPIMEFNAESEAEKIISERLLTFKDINGLVGQNVQLRSIVRSLSDQIEIKEMELKEKFEMELQKHNDEAASKVHAVLTRAEEQGRMIESLHTSVAMYKRLYEEEHKLHLSNTPVAEAAPQDGRRDFMLLLEGSQKAAKKAQEAASDHVKGLEENLGKLRSELISLRSERDKLALEANFAREKLERYMKEVEHQRDETNAIVARNVEFSQLLIDYQRRVRESSESLHVAEELSRKLTMEVSVLKHEKEMLLSSEKRASDEVCSLSERVRRLQASLDTIQSAEEVREEARRVERRKQEEHIKHIEQEWAEAKKELQEERDNVRRLTLDREEIMKNAMRQVEEIGKELAKSLNAVAAAEARAAVAEARYSDVEKKNNSGEAKITRSDGEHGLSYSSTNEGISDLQAAKEEIEKLREEAQANKEHMLQYKNIANVNEDALKQMEFAHENFKTEADRVKKAREAEISSLKDRVIQLETEYSLKSAEVVSLAAEKEATRASCFSEVEQLKEECASKISQIAAMEMKFSALKEDLEKEHQRWRDAQTNYERQVILQSETIQELNKTSNALGLLQQEASELRKLVDTLKTENNDLKAKWGFEKSILEETKNDSEKKYREIDEQNKILHSRLEALHIKLAEKDRNSSGISSGSNDQDPLHDNGLQSVVNYLRRSKEIAETEISLLKQEKLRLQSQFESALKAAETAQASLHAERANSRATLLTEEEFKSLQLQVRELNLLRESNLQLREENKQNFEECQKLHEVSQKVSIENEQLLTSLREIQAEVEAYKKETEMLKIQKEHLENRVDELLERCKKIDVEDYVRMREVVQQMQVNSSVKDGKLEEMKKLLSEKDVAFSQLELELATSRNELNERESRLNKILQVEGSLKLELEKQKKAVALLKKKMDGLLKEKEDLSKENQALSKQLEEYKQGLRGTGDAAGEQVIKEKDTKIQILEKTVERQREELKKEKEELKKEKEREREKRQNTEKTILENLMTVSQHRSKLVDGIEKHKLALNRLYDEVEKIKQAKSRLPEDASVVQIVSGTELDELSAAYLLALENFERVARSVSSGFGPPLVDLPPKVDASTSGVNAGQAVPPLAPSIPPAPVSTLSLPLAKQPQEKPRRVPKTNVEARKIVRRLVRPQMAKREEAQVDPEMSEAEGASHDGKPVSSHNLETQGDSTMQNAATVRKRSLSSSTSDLPEDSGPPHDASPQGAMPSLKKSRGSDLLQEATEVQSAVGVENLEALPAVEDPSDVGGDVLQESNEEAFDAEKEDVGGVSGEQDEEPKDGDMNRLQSREDSIYTLGENSQTEFDMFSETWLKGPAEEDVQQLGAESGSDREEGELDPDLEDVGSGDNTSKAMETQEIMENQPGAVASPRASPGVEGEDLVPATMDSMEAGTPLVVNEEKIEEADKIEATDDSDNLNDNNNQGPMQADQIPEAIPDTTTEKTSTTTTTVEVGGSKEGGQSTATVETQEVRQQSPAVRSSTTINLRERAKEAALIRQQGMTSSQGRGRGRLVRGRGRGSGGRGQSSGGQG